MRKLEQDLTETRARAMEVQSRFADQMKKLLQMKKINMKAPAEARPEARGGSSLPEPGSASPEPIEDHLPQVGEPVVNEDMEEEAAVTISVDGNKVRARKSTAAKLALLESPTPQDAPSAAVGELDVKVKSKI